MKDTNKKIAIYSRKSKFTGKGDSINNQIEYCKKHLLMKYPELDVDKDIIIFEDEGFSGGNINRPQFQEMLNLIRENKLECVCCYKLDRISRNVLDFSSLNSELEKYNVSFLSVTESFDTTTPLGKAMLTITSVFAQLERDTIAERIRDNMLELAKSGRWLGGTTPTGFTAEQVKYTTGDGKERTLWKLSPIKAELDLIKLLFQKYDELKSLTKLETYLVQNNIKTKNNIDYSRFALKNILTNPVYAVGDKEVYNYFVSNNVEVHNELNEFNSKHGLMVYNKTSQTTNKQRYKDITDWIVALGKHKGIIPGKLWVDTQINLKSRGSKAYRTITKNNALLSGTLRCAHCGSFMRPKLKSYNAPNGELAFTYMCELKEKSRKVKCQCTNINGNEADKLVIDTIENLIYDESTLHKRLSKIANGTYNKASTTKNELMNLKKQYDSNERDISNYTKKIMHLNEDALELVNKEITSLKNKNINIKSRIEKIEENTKSKDQEQENAKICLEIINTYFNTFHDVDLETKRNMIKVLVDSITTDGDTLTINFLNSDESNNNKLSPLCDDSK